VSNRDRIDLASESWGRFVYRRRWWVLATACLFAVGWSCWIPQIALENSTESYLLRGDPASSLYREFRAQFGQDNQILVGIAPPEVFDLGFLERLRDFHRALEDEVPHIEEVTSLITARQTRGEGDELIVEELLEDWPQTEAELGEIAARARANPVYRNFLLSEDARFTAVVLRPVAYSSGGAEGELLAGFDDAGGGGLPEQELEFLSQDETAQIVSALNRVVARFEAPDFPLYPVGEILTSQRLNDATWKDTKSYVGATALAIAALLFLLFRRVSGVVLPFVVVAASLLTTLGVMVSMGIPGSMAIQVLPVFVMTVGVCNAVHVLVITYQRLDAGAEVEDAIAFAFAHSGPAIVMTNLTTAAGMSSFLAASITPITHLGITASIGVLAVLFYTFGLLPALLAILPLKRGLSRKPRRSLLRALVVRTGDLATVRPRLVLIGSAAVMLVVLGGTARTHFSHDHLKWFEEDDPLRVAAVRVDREMRGSNTVEVLVTTGSANGLHEPEVLRRIEAASERAGTVAEGEFFVGKVVSIVDIVKETNQALNENRPQHYAIPDDRQLTAQELLLFENSGSDDLEQITDSQFQTARVTLRVPLLDGVIYPRFLSRIGEIFRDALGEDLDFSVTGIAPLMARASSAVVTSLVRSYAIALAVITPLMVLLIGRLRVGLLSMVPNLIPVFAVLGVMGLCGVPLDASNIILGSVIISLAVDDTIHIMHRFQRDFERSRDVRDAVRRTLSTTGSALLFTSLVLTTGFLVLAGLGSMSNTLVFGLFAALGIVVAFVADVLIAPALLAVVFEGADSARDLTARRSLGTALRFR
jgi:predicted RND superfamily exporter protein